MAKKGKKKDTGIIPGVGLREEVRDRLAKKDWTHAPERREDNPDTWTTKECTENRFSGLRVDHFRDMAQIWCVGRMMVERPRQAVLENPGVLADMHEEAFATAGTVIGADLPVKKLPLSERKKLN